ncbi:MAG: hypothetical protein GY943_11200 [Chloroflexi bacterium]|nr:hypothetical protein [Chloroflexota bacterium]
MNQNISSIYRLAYITTNSRKQRKMWQKLFHVDTLPVRSPEPDEAVDRNGRSRWFYTLDPVRMSPRQLHRLAAHITAQQWGAQYAETLDRIRAVGHAIDAERCELVTPEMGLPNFRFRQAKLPSSFIPHTQ